MLLLLTMGIRIFELKRQPLSALGEIWQVT